MAASPDSSSPRQEDAPTLAKGAVPPSLTFGTAGWKQILLVVLGVALCLAMSWFQLWRAETRGARFEREQAARLSTPIDLTPRHRGREELLDHAVVAHGTWLPDKTLFLDNKIFRSRPGYHVLTPLLLSGGDIVVLVNRGWIPAPRLRSEMPTVSTPTGEVEITGVTASFETKFFELKDVPPEGLVWQHVRENDFRRHLGRDMMPVQILQTGGSDDGMRREWAPAENPGTKHYGYAVMWLVFAAMAAGYGYKLLRGK